MSFNPKLLLPVSLGLSLVAVTAVVVYYVFKKDDDETVRRDKRTTHVNIIEVNVPKSIAPALIGRGGENIKDIEAKSGAMIKFKKFNDKDYDVCTIWGRAQATQLAETMVIDFINEQPVIKQDTMEVPGWACGRIIGSGGESINEISHRSGARVKIDSSSRNPATERVVVLKGTDEQIAHAKKLIEGCVAQEKCRREINAARNPRLAPTSPSSGAPASTLAPADVSQLPGDRRAKYKRPEGAGAPIEVYVSAVSSPSRFWVQLVGPQVSQLDELVNNMTEYYGDKANRERHALSNVSVGQVVAAVFRHDGRWYRARVDDIRPNEFDNTQQVADVFYLDYGDSEYVAVHELCELRADLLRLRFQAMECFLAGVSPPAPEPVSAISPVTVEVTDVETCPTRWERWPNHAVERFEELTQVAKWKALVSRTCTYKKMTSGERDKEIPGMKLFDVTEEGELDIGATLIAEGLALPAAIGSRGPSPRTSPPPPPTTPFGDLGKSMVLGVRATSVPKDHKDDHVGSDNAGHGSDKENDRMTSSKSISSGLGGDGDGIKTISNFDMSYPNTTPPIPHNGSSDFLNAERQNIDSLNHKGSTDTLVPKSPLDDMKANMNRMDSHHNLESLAHAHNDASK